MTNQTSPTTLMRAQDGAGVVTVEDVFATGRQDLWSALTEPHRLARWVARVDGDLRPGGSFHATFTSGWDGAGRVDVCEPPHRLVLAMAPDTAEATVIEATLTAVGDRTRLVVEERGLPLSDLPFHGAGWQVHLADLGSHLAGRTAEDWEPRWRELLPAFRGRSIGS
jgi:uncharacterized protein YndB with AHSA1/START domain